jgi:Antibiotic biosynthesis monooxygenase
MRATILRPARCGRISGVLVISRFRYDDDLTERARTELGTCLTMLEEQPGFVSGAVGRAMDDPTLWVLQTTWKDVGSYRRALSSYEIKANVVPLLSYAVDEPSAYEVIEGEGATEPNEQQWRHLGN